MPTYGYRCPNCSLEFDVWQRMTDEPAAPCPKCATVAQRLFFPAGIVFKGSGFYKTDSRKPQSSGDKGASSTSSGDKGASSTSSGDKGSASTSSDGGSPRSKTAGTDRKAASGSAPATSE